MLLGPSYCNAAHHHALAVKAAARTLSTEAVDAAGVGPEVRAVPDSVDGPLRRTKPREHGSPFGACRRRPFGACQRRLFGACRRRGSPFGACRRRTPRGLRMGVEVSHLKHLRQAASLGAFRSARTLSAFAVSVLRKESLKKGDPPLGPCRGGASACSTDALGLVGSKLREMQWVRSAGRFDIGDGRRIVLLSHRLALLALLSQKCTFLPISQTGQDSITTA